MPKLVKPVAVFCIGVVAGVLFVLGLRFAIYQPDAVHYHANFAVFINGERQDFKGAQYYEEETSMCASGNTRQITPVQRVHMHDNVNNVVHIEDHAVTWGAFFANLGWYVAPDFIRPDNGTIYGPQGNARLHIIINGQNYTGLGGVANTVIKDQDRLLLSYGDETNDQLDQQYSAVPSTAHHYDTTPDPAACSGHEAASLSEKLSHLF